MPLYAVIVTDKQAKSRGALKPHIALVMPRVIIKSY